MIRHGESTANLDQVVSGSVDVALTDRGIEQAHEAAKIVAALDVKPSVIIHSHLQRARETARILNQNIGASLFEDPLIAEQFYGDWEGRPWSESRQSIRDGIDPPNGESHAAFHDRVKTAITKFVNSHNGPVMIVCHGGVFRAFGALYGEKIHGITNCSLHQFEPFENNKSFPWNIKTF